MPSLPDISPLAALPAEVWKRFGERLRAGGFDADFLQGFGRIGMKSYAASLERPMLEWHVRRRSDPASYLFRIFMLRDPVADDEAAGALGQPLVETLVDAGLLIRPEPGCVVSVLDLRIFRGLLILCDDLSHRGDAVFGVGPGTAAFCAPTGRAGTMATALDLGCGAGGAALWLRRHAARVVAADINPRALAFVGINAAINQVTDVEVQQGDLFEAVPGRSFDFIISQPPYVPHAPGAPPATYLFGGPRGGELVSRILSDVPRHLQPGGRAVLVFDQPFKTAAGEERRPALPVDESMQVLLLLGAEVGAESYSVRYATPELRVGMDAFNRAATDMREHLENVDIGSLCPAICVLEHARPGEGWTAILRAGDTLWNEVSTGTVDRLLAGQAFLHGQARGAPRVRIPDSSLVVAPFTPDGSAPDKVHLGLPRGYLLPSLALGRQEWETLQALHRGEAPAAAAEVVAKAARAGLIDA